MTVADTGWAKSAWGKIYGQWICGSAVFVLRLREVLRHPELLAVIARNTA